MQGLALVELLPAAVGIALNPPAIVSAILMLSSSNPRAKALSFLAGWMVGLFLVGSAVLIAGDLPGSRPGPSKIAFVIKLVLGFVLLVFAFRQWRSHRSVSAGEEVPRWMRSMVGFSSPKAFGAAAALAAFNPKTLALNVAGVMIILEAHLRVPAEWAALVVFVVFASVTVAAPVVYYLIAPRHSELALESSKRWLIVNNAAIIGTVLLILGVMLLGAGIQGLIAP